MARAFGFDALMLGAFESSFDTPPADGFRKLWFVSTTVGADQELVPDTAVGFGSRLPRDPMKGNITVDGDVVAPLDARDIGFWLTGALGVPETTGAGPYMHTFTAGGSIPSLTLEVGHPAVPSYSLNHGLKVGGFSLDLDAGETAKNVTFNLIGRRELIGTTTVDASPTEATRERLVGQLGSILIDGVANGQISGGSVEFSNGLEPGFKAFDGTHFLSEPQPNGLCAFTGTLTARFENHALLDKAVAGTPVALRFAWVKSAGLSLTLEAPRCTLRRTRRPVSGPGGIEATFEFIASATPSTPLLTATLVNDSATA